MNLSFNQALAQGYKSQAQIIRRLSEDWLLNNAYCPCCGQSSLSKFENNRPVADFYCPSCHEEFELKSKRDKLDTKVTGGAYATMIERIQSDNNPNFFFLSYSQQGTVKDCLVIPKHFFSANMIIKRKPLAATAKRAGWVGCTINLSRVVAIGKIFLLKNAQAISPEQVKKAFQQTLFLREKSQSSRGWTLAVMACVDAINKEHFALDEVYAFENRLKQQYPDNRFIKDKIRQQLQILRDQGLIEFVSPGQYRKVYFTQ